MNNRTKLYVLALSLGAILIHQPLKGDLIVEETFEAYAEGSLSGQVTNTEGLKGTWTGMGDVRIEQNILSENHGQSLVVNPSGKWVSIGLETNSLIPSEEGSSVAIGFTIKLISANSENSQILVHFADDNIDGQGIQVGQIWGQNFFGISQGAPSETPLDTEEHRFLIIVKRVGGGVLEAQLYIDPVEPARLPLSAQKPAAIGWPKNKDIRRIGFKSNGNGFIVDDIRISSDPAEAMKVTGVRKSEESSTSYL